MRKSADQSKSILRQLIRCSSPARSLAEMLARRSNKARVTKVRIASKKTGVNKSEIIALFKLLEELELGRFIEGRHGRESRMLWSIDTSLFAQAK